MILNRENLISLGTIGKARLGMVPSVTVGFSTVSSGIVGRRSYSNNSRVKSR